MKNSFSFSCRTFVWPSTLFNILK